MSFKDFYSQECFQSPNLSEEAENPLPISFLINETFFKSLLEKYFRNFEFIEELKYENLHIFFIKTDKKELKKSPKYRNFREKFNVICEMGLVTRQEIVSMMPVHFLSSLLTNKENIIALDLCASPGSKTLQLMNICDLITANDVNIKRLNVLTTNICKKQKYIYKKSYTIQTSYDAKCFPTYVSTNENGYNIILCDVPCSGDGTIKKNPHIIEKWEQPVNIFNLQYKILEKSIQIFKNSKKEEKYLCYSTCSLNPLENEFIVNCLLEENKDLELVDLRQLHKEIKRMEGLCSFDYEIQISIKQFKRICKDFNLEINENGIENHKLKNFLCFEKKGNEILMKYKFDNKDLCKTARFMPKKITGGFYIAIFRLKENMKRGRTIYKPRFVNELKPHSVDLQNLHPSVYDKNVLLSNSDKNNTLYEVPEKFKNYIFPLTEFAGIIRAEKVKSKPSNTLLRNINKLTGVCHNSKDYRLKNVNQLINETDLSISYESLIKIFDNLCLIDDLLEDDIFIDSLFEKTKVDLSVKQFKNLLITLNSSKEISNHISPIEYLKISESFPIGPVNLKYQELVLPCRVSGKIEIYMNNRERNLIKELLKYSE